MVIMEIIELQEAAAGIVASGHVIVNCKNIIVYNNTTPVREKRNDKNDEKQESNKKEEQTQATQDICHGCKEPIVGLVVTALGKKWHQEHWVCFHCKQELYTSTSTIYYEVDGKPYCRKDFGIYFCDYCATCNEPIFDGSLSAMGKTWHKDHFVCTHCGINIAKTRYYNHDGKLYCKDDYSAKFADRCARCNKPIMEKFRTALDKKWHTECFACSECHVPFGENSFWKYENEPYCELHYREKNGTICASCHHPIDGQYYTALSRKYHLEHFICYICNKQLDNNNYKTKYDHLYCHGCYELRISLSNMDNVWHQKHIVCEKCEKQLTWKDLIDVHDGKSYCRDDYIALFSEKCYSCKKNITGEWVSALRRKWHSECFACWECKIKLHPSSFFTYDNEPYCESHYQAMSGRICAYCYLPINHQYTSMEGRNYHPDHVICFICFKTLDNRPYKIKEDNLYCYACYNLFCNN